MVMESNETPSATPLPRVLKVLGEGCSTAANNVTLMALPMALDLFLLFGPRLRVSRVLQPVFDTAYGQMLQTVPAGTAAQLEPALEAVRSILRSVNLFASVQTFPIGVSAINAFGGDSTPLGSAVSVEMTSILQIIPILAALLLLGVFLGTAFFSLTARASVRTGKKFTVQDFGKQFLNTVLFYLALIVVLFILSVPVSCIMTFSFMISPIIYQLLTIVLIAAGCWLVIPLFYIPHSIFVNNYDLPQSIRESIQLGSWSGPVTVRFILFSIVITMGLDMIWAIPEQSSWLVLISIFGHAYVSAAMLSGSFILFKELEQWQQENQAFLTWRKAYLRLPKLFKKEPEQHD